MFLFRTILSAVVLLLIVACGGGGNSTSSETNPPLTTDPPPPPETDPALSPTRLAGDWITSNGCGFDTGRLIITEGIDGAFYLSLFAQGTEGPSNVQLYPAEIVEGEYSATGMVEFKYRAEFRSSNFLYWEPLFIGDFALTMDGGELYMSSICAGGIDYNAMFTTEGSSQQEHGDRFAASASAIQSQLRQQYDDAHKEITFDLAGRGSLDSSVAIQRYAELRAWYLSSLETDLGILITQYKLISLARIYVEQTLVELKQEDLALFPDHQDEVEAMYNGLLTR